MILADAAFVIPKYHAHHAVAAVIGQAHAPATPMT
jgi:hypothetical protein